MAGRSVDSLGKIRGPLSQVDFHVVDDCSRSFDNVFDYYSGQNVCCCCMKRRLYLIGLRVGIYMYMERSRGRGEEVEEGGRVLRCLSLKLHPR